MCMLCRYKLKIMAERPDPYPDEADERIRKLSREKEELKNKVTMAEQREQVK